MVNSNDYMNNYMKNRWYRRRSEAITFLGGCCVRCGETENLEFHHIDPSTKSFTIAKGSSFSDLVFWSEIEKCELLCSNCHRTNHSEENKCGSPQKYWQGCRCQLCREANAQYGRDYKKRRMEHLDSDV